MLETARELGVTIIAYTPLASGLLTAKYHKHPELLRMKPIYWRLRLAAGVEKSRRIVDRPGDASVRHTVSRRRRWR